MFAYIYLMNTKRVVDRCKGKKEVIGKHVYQLDLHLNVLLKIPLSGLLYGENSSWGGWWSGQGGILKGVYKVV